MIELKKIGLDNIWALVKLTVRDDQKKFVATNTKSILEAYATIADGYIALPFAIYEGDTPVGFVMFGYGTTDDEDEPKIAADNYCLWRFMIDREYQGRGLGRQALSAALDYIKSFPCGPAEYCWLSYESENTVAKALYNSFGFQENGECCGDETIAVLKL